MWTVHAAYRTDLADPAALAAIGEELAEHGAAVSRSHDQVHVDLALDADDLIAAGARAVQLLHTAGLHLQALSQIEVVDGVEAARRQAAGVTR